MQVLRLEVLQGGVAEYGSLSLCWRVRVEAFRGGGGMGEGNGESDADRLWDGAVLGGCTLVFLTRTEEGSSEDRCFSRDRICRQTGGKMKIHLSPLHFLKTVLSLRNVSVIAASLSVITLQLFRQKAHLCNFIHD